MRPTTHEGMLQMTFLTVLLSLFVERVLPQYRPGRRFRWFDGYCRRLATGSFGEWLVTRPWGVAAILLPPLLLIAWLQAFFAELGGLFELAFGGVVLLYSLGPRDIGDEAEAFVAARDGGMDERADSLAQALCLTAPPTGEPRRSFGVARAIVVLASRRLVAPIFWFVILGPFGAAAYRGIVLLSEHLRRGDYPEQTKHYGEEMRRLADWAPARVTAAGYAIAGNFDAVAHAWRSLAHTVDEGPLTEAERLLANTGLAALDTFPENADDLEAGTTSVLGTAAPPVVEDALALVWRSLAVLIAIIAGGSLVAALA